MATYNVVKVKRGEGEKKYYQPVGKLVLRENRKTGVLFLHIFDGEYAVFAAEKKGEGQGEAG